MSSAPSDSLSPQELQWLQEDEIVLPGPLTGKRKVSTAFLKLPSSAPSSISTSSSSSSTASVRFHQLPTAGISNFDLPISPLSSEALEFIGFTTTAASEIWSRWLERPDPTINPDEPIDYAFGHINRLKLPAFQDMDPAAAVESVGLDAETQNVLLDPEFTNIFLSNSLHHWAYATLKSRHATMLQLQDRLKNYAKQSGNRRQQKKKRASLEGVFPSTQPQANQELPEPTASLNMMTETHRLPANHVTVVTGPPQEALLDHIVLYKGRVVGEMHGLDPWIRSDGTINMSVMRSSPGGDFNHSSFAHYWTYDIDVAEKYRQWAARRDPNSESWLISIQVPNAFLSSLNSTDLWFSAEWKEYVWSCKRMAEPPAKFDYLWKSPWAVDVVRGHICVGVDRAITRLQENEVQTGITVDNVMKGGSENRKATQPMFSEACANRLGVEIRGKVRIEIFPPVGRMS